MILNALERIIADGSKSIIVFTFIGALTLVTLISTPALCATLLSNQTLSQEDTFVSRWAERLYRPRSIYCGDRPKSFWASPSHI